MPRNQYGNSIIDYKLPRKKIMKLLIITILFCISNITYAEKNNIIQLLGFELGKTITTQELKKIAIPSSRKIYKNEYQIKPNKIKIPFRKFQICYITINSQNKIIKIEAIYKSRIEEKIKEEYEITKQILERKYFTKIKQPFTIANKERTRFLTLDLTNQEVKLRCFITDQDPAINNQQKIKKEIEQTDTTGI